MASTDNSLIKVNNLKKHYPVTKGAITKTLVGTVKAIDGISFDINKGETFSLVGESGCGKTTTTKMILMSEPPTDGIVQYEGSDMAEFTTASRKEFKSLGKVSDWRIRLCNTSDDSFVLDDVTWKNVHHYYLAQDTLELTSHNFIHSE